MTRFEADRVEVRVLLDNWVDMLLPDVIVGDCCVERSGLIEHFDPKLEPPVAENGLSLLVRVWRGERVTTLLFDIGLTGTALAHNLRALDENPTMIDHVLISHGHPDHFGGISTLLPLVGRPVPVVTHPDAFLARYAVMGDGRTSGFYNLRLNESELEAQQGRVVATRDPIELGWGAVTTGEIPRETSFEGPRPAPWVGAPGLYQVSADGKFVLDEVWDEQALAIKVRDVGILVLVGCSHAGVINSIARARALLGDGPICAVFGGFHLGFPTTPTENVSLTADAFKQLEVQHVIPMHCSGLRAHSSFFEDPAVPYIQPSVGSRFLFGRP